MSEMLLGSGLFVVIVVALGLLVMGVRRLLLPFRNVEITINDSQTLIGQTGQKLLGILTDSGIPVPNSCAGAGTCGLCRVQVTTGGGTPLPTEAARLTRDELRTGQRLSCQVTVRDNLEVVIPDELLNVDTMTCRVAAARSLSPLIREIALELPDGQTFDFHAGAFVQVTAPPFRLRYTDIEISPAFQSAWERLGLQELVAQSDDEVSRAYSVASIPAEKGRIVLQVRLALPPPDQPGVPAGVVSSYLFGLKPGEQVDVAGPYGSFRVQDTEREMVFIGGGVGMAPLRAMIYQQLEQVGTKRKISFWYGARSKIDLFHAEELDALAARHENFSWTPALSDPAPEDHWQGATGFVHAVVFTHYLKTHPAPEDCEYYLCGPPLMIQSVFGMLDECGVDDDSIFFDDFGI